MPPQGIGSGALNAGAGVNLEGTGREDSHAAMELTSSADSLLAMRAMQSGAWARRRPVCQAPNWALT